jgi:uncharacterized protein YjiS (DUF1127 family)
MCEEMVMSKATMAVGNVDPRELVRQWLVWFGHSMATLVLKRAGKRAIRDIRALGDPTLADIGLTRSDLMLICTILTKAQAAEYLAQLNTSSFASPGGRCEDQQL